MGIFDLNLDEYLEKAEKDIELNSIINKIVKEANYQLINKEVHKYNLGLSRLNNQTVGAEIY